MIQPNLPPIFRVAGVFDEMDVLARAQFLEGYLKIKPFGKIRGAQGKTALLRIIAHMMVEAGATSEDWAAKGDTGFYRSVFLSVNRAIRSQVGERSTEAADILQAMMGLTGWETEEGETVEIGGKSPFWLAGKYAADRDPSWMAKGMRPDDATGLAVRLAQRRTLDVLRQELERQKKRRDYEGEIFEETVSQTDSDDSDWGSVIDTIFSNSSHPLSRKFFDWLYGKIPGMLGPKESQIMTSYLDLLRSGEVSGQSKGGGDSEAARRLGVPPNKLWDAKKSFTDKLSKYLSAHPDERDELQGMFADAGFFRNLQRGRFASLAAKVASRFLARMAGKFAARRDFKFKREVKLKDGTVIPKGTPATVSYDGKTAIGYVHIEGVRSEPAKIGIARLSDILDGYPKMPSLARLEKMDSDGIATTPTGARVEPDGYGPDGSPSWLIIAGVI